MFPWCDSIKYEEILSKEKLCGKNINGYARKTETIRRPTHSKKNTSHACWFRLLEVVVLFKFLIIDFIELIIIYLGIKGKFMIFLYLK